MIVRTHIPNETFDNITEWERRDVIDKLRSFSEITLDLFFIEFGDLLVLDSIWKCISPRRVRVVAYAVDDMNMTQQQLEVVARMMRACPRANKIIHIGPDFVNKRFAALFNDVVFDLVAIHVRGQLNGAAIPPCRAFRFPEGGDRNVVISPGDALVSSVRKFSLSSDDDEDISTYAPLRPDALTVFVNPGDRLLERVHDLFPRIKKLKLDTMGRADVETAKMVARFQELETLVFRTHEHSENLREFFRVVGTLPRLKRLRVVSNVANDWDFLLELPRLEKFGCDLENQYLSTTSPMHTLMHLRSLVFYNSFMTIGAENQARADICEMRQTLIDEVLSLHRIVARAAPSNVAQVICLMILEKSKRKVALEIIRNPPQRNALDDRWEM